jgi:hypothetical protein
MRTAALAAVTGVMVLLGAATPSSAQGDAAELRTWAGHTLHLSDASLEVFYTIMPPPQEGGAAAQATGSAAPTGAQRGRFSGLQLLGSMQSLGSFFEKGPEPLQGHRASDVVTLQRGKTAIQVPIARIAALIFTRQPIRSPLPPYVRQAHFRHSAVAVLTDGTRVDGDYVNLGTAVLRGTTVDGRVDVPWQEIESLRFAR